ncbi:MAG TPA: amidohydrolase family protein, partial [Candidatus Krumholzibacteriaceae bacterium]|nr:amidohydrolase family protein [Candidatus Krumholzibacteriaceae bacterium]
PKVLAWLMSRKARTDTMLESNKAVMKKTTLAGNYREYTFNEVAIVTRAATAKVLGLKHKGHLGVGADADVSVYDVDPSKWRPSQYAEIERAFRLASYTIKGGEVVVKDGEVTSTPLGSTYWVKAETPPELEQELVKELEADFKNYYTVSFKNYPVEDAYLPTQRVVKAQGGAWK